MTHLKRLTRGPLQLYAAVGYTTRCNHTSSFAPLWKNATLLDRCASNAQVPHTLDEIPVRCFNDEVMMVVHQAIGVAKPRPALDDGAPDGEKHLPIVVMVVGVSDAIHLVVEARKRWSVTSVGRSERSAGTELRAPRSRTRASTRANDVVRRCSLRGRGTP